MECNSICWWNSDSELIDNYIYFHFFITFKLDSWVSLNGKTYPSPVEVKVGAYHENTILLFDISVIISCG